jgi:hypothetical protein
VRELYTEGQDTRFAASRLLVLATNLNEIEAHRQQTLRELSCRSERRQEPAGLIIAAVLTIADENARRPPAVDLRHYFANCRLAARPQQVTRPPSRVRQHVLRTKRRRRRRASPPLAPDSRHSRARAAPPLRSWSGSCSRSKTSVLTEQKTKRSRCSRIAFRLHGDPRTLIRVGGEQFRELMSGADTAASAPTTEQGVLCKPRKPCKVIELPGRT